MAPLVLKDVDPSPKLELINLLTVILKLNCFAYFVFFQILRIRVVDINF